MESWFKFLLELGQFSEEENDADYQDEDCRDKLTDEYDVVGFNRNHVGLERLAEDN